MCLFECRQWLTLSLWVSIDIPIRTCVDETRRKVVFRSAEFEAKDPRLSQIELFGCIYVSSLIRIAGMRCEEEYVLASKAFVYLRVVAPQRWT